MQIVSNIALISINETLIIQLVSFLIFYFIIRRIMVLPLRGVIQERNNRIGNIQKEINDSESEMNSLLKQLQVREKHVREESFKQKLMLEQEGDKKANEILKGVQQEIDQLRKAAQDEVNEQLAKANQFLKTESERLAIQIMEKVLERRLN